MCKKCDEALEPVVEEVLLPEPEPEPEVPQQECRQCSNSYDEDSMTHIGNHWRYGDQYVCEGCLHSYYRHCDSCGSLHHRGDLSNGYCEECYSERYTTCESCGDEVDRDDAGWDDDCAYCSRCWNDRNNRVIYDHSYDVTDQLPFLGMPADKVYYGIELEVECARPRNKGDNATTVAHELTGYALLKEDGSIDNGFEIVTAPASMDVHMERFGGWLDTLPSKRIGLRSYDTTTCGLHIHVSRAALTKLQIGKMQCFLHNSANQRLVDCIAQRPSTSYAERKYEKKLTDRSDGERYTALNLQNHATVELRIFKGTLNKRSFLKSLEFTQALVNYTKAGVASTKDAVDGRTFLYWVQDPVRAKHYKNLISFLLDKGYPMRPVSRPNALLPVVAANEETIDGELQACA